MIEHFTNSLSRTGSDATLLVNKMVQNKEDVINIQYHTNFPGRDPYFNDNPGDVSARILFYGLTKVPYTFIDGGSKNNFANLADHITTKLDSNDISRRTMITPGFEITIDAVVTGGVLTINTALKALTDINSNNLTLFLAVTEKENRDHPGANNEYFYNIFQKFIPDAGGISLKKLWTKGEALTIPSKTWTIENIKNSSSIEVIAFIQNNLTKEIYQTGSMIKSNAKDSGQAGYNEDSSEENGNAKSLAKEFNFSIFPNPAKEKISLGFEEPLSSDSDIRIYDSYGQVIKSYKAGNGSTEFSISNPGLRPGIYMIRISSGGIDLGFKKLIISGM